MRILNTYAAGGVFLALAIACFCAAPHARAQITFKSQNNATGPSATISFVNSSTATLGASGAAATIALRGQSSGSTTGSSLSLSMPAGTVEDDVMIAVVVVTTSETTPNLPSGVNAPAGWTNIENNVITTAQESPGQRFTVFRKRAASGETGPYVFTIASGTSAGMVGGILSFSGVEVSGDPVISESATVSTLAGNVVSAPTRLAPGINNTMLMTFHAYASSSTWLPPSGATTGTLTEAFQASSIAPPAALGVSMVAGYKNWPTNIATGTVSATANSGAPANNEGRIGYSLLLRPALPITISAPANLAAGDVMIASISLRGAAMGVQAPAGWTLIRRTNGNTDLQATATSLFTYRKLADAGDVGSSYRFATSGGINGVGGIAAYRNVDGGDPIDAENGVAASASGASETMTGPQVTTTVPDTRLVTSFAISNARNWSNASGGLTERVDVIHPTTATDTGVALAMHDVARAATGTAGPFSADNNGGEDDAGAAHLLALRPHCAITISKPNSPLLATGDVMVAAISVRDMTTVTTVPAGWTLAPNAPVHNSTAGGTLSLFVYFKNVANAAAEPASYQWIFQGCTHVTGGIQVFSGVDTAAPISASAGQATSSSLTHAAPTVIPAAGNTMLVYAFAFRSAATWTRSSTAMSEDYDIAIPAPQDTVGLAMAAYHEAGPASAGATTPARSATASNDADTGVTFTLALKPLVVAVTPARFNAYDTPVSGITGVIKTKVSGSDFSIAVVAVNPAGTAIETTFNDKVQVEVVNSLSGGTLDASNCNTGWPVIATTPVSYTVMLTSGSGTITTVNVANSYRNARIRIIYPVGASYAAATAKGCSTDNFAIRPASFTTRATDSTWSAAATAGAVPPDRFLNNTAATGGNVHKAGQPFTITVTPAPASASLYDGSPIVNALTCVLGTTCTPAMLTSLSFTGAGTRVSNATKYNEAGAFNLTLRDEDYAIVDTGDGTPADCSANGRYVCDSAAPLAVGRFVPDHFTFAAPAIAVLRTFNTTSCSPRSFTYIGQPFWYSTRPSATLNAVNASGTVTANYSVTSSKPSLSESYADATAPATAPLNSSAAGSPVLTAGSGTGTYSASVSASAQLSYDRHPSTVSGPFTAAIKLTVTASDSSESAVTGNGTITTDTPLIFPSSGAGIAFDSGAQLRYGRLQIGTARGSHLAALGVPMETQYSANGTTFVTNTADNCTTIDVPNIGLGNYAGNLNAGETTPSLSGAFVSGKKTLLLSAPGAGNNGSVDLVVNLGSTMDSCTTFKPVPSTTGASQSWLRGQWCGATQSKDTTGRATFGIQLGAEEVIYFRENF